MASTEVFNELCVKTALLRSIPNEFYRGYVLPVMHQSDAYSSTSYSREI